MRGGKTIRLFICVNLEPDIKSVIDNNLIELRKNYRGVKWVKPENLHITLKFLGETSVEQLAGIKDSLSKIALNNQEFTLALGGTGVFPNLKKPRVIWLGITEGKDNLSSIRDSLENEMYKLNFPKENRGFKGHITLGRIKKFQKNMGESILKLLQLDNPGKQEVKSLDLMKSNLKPEGPVYELLESYNLAV